MERYAEPDFLPWDGKRVPVTFVSGYLGAGKTTLINAVLAGADRPIAVFVNDVGEINIDARLVRRRHGDTVELTDGCVCCSLSDGFGAAFDDLRARPAPPSHLLIELSGVADPSRVLPWARSAGFVLDGVVTVVNAETISERIDDPAIASTLTSQIRSADVLVVNREAALTAPQRDKVRQAVATLAPHAGIVSETDGYDATETPATVLLIGGRRGSLADPVPPPTLFDRHVTTTVPLPNPISRIDLDQLVASLPADTVRAKGIAAATDGTRLLVHRVGGRVSIEVLPQAEDEPPTDLVVITVPHTPADQTQLPAIDRVCP